MLQGFWVCLLTVFGVYVIYQRAVYFLVFFAVNYGLGVILSTITRWGYWNPLIFFAWLSIIPGILLSVKTNT